jgi:hypothetical protein
MIAFSKIQGRIVAALVTVLCGGLFKLTVVNAQALPDSTTVAYFQSKPFAEMVVASGMQLDKHLLNMEPCPGSYGFDPVTFAIQRPLEFAEGKAHPIAGTWTWRFKFKRCGSEKVYHMRWRGNPTGTPIPDPLIPGMSRVDPVLANTVRNVVGSAGILHHGVGSDCRSLRILETRVTMEPKKMSIEGAERTGVWQEEWTGRMCDQEIKVPVCFVPDPNRGTSVTAKACLE